jgi:hypothetical protein
MQAPDVTKRSAWLTPGVLGIGLATMLADPGHEVPTALLPSLLTFLIAGDPLAVDGRARWAILVLPSQETIQVTSSKMPKLFETVPSAVTENSQGSVAACGASVSAVWKRSGMRG